MKREQEYCYNRLCQEPVWCAGMCRRCYQRMHYWLKRTPADIVKRRQTLAKWAETMEHLMPETVTSIQPKRKKRA